MLGSCFISGGDVNVEEKLITCHFCHDIILNSVGTMALQEGVHMLSTKFPTVEDVSKHFIVTAIGKYLVMALQEFNNNKRKRLRLKRKVPVTKNKWNIKREKKAPRWKLTWALVHSIINWDDHVRNSRTSLRRNGASVQKKHS